MAPPCRCLPSSLNFPHTLNLSNQSASREHVLEAAGGSHHHVDAGVADLVSLHLHVNATNGQQRAQLGPAVCISQRAERSNDG